MKYVCPQFYLSVPQNTKVAVGSGTRECRQKEDRPAPPGLRTPRGRSASAPRSRFLHSSGELRGKMEQWVSIRGTSTENRLKNKKGSGDWEIEPTFRSLGQTHTQPAHAALTAHTGRAGAEGVEGNGSDDQRQV